MSSGPDTVDMKPHLQTWADITIKEFEQKVKDLEIHEGALLNSFVNHVYWNAGGNLDKIVFAFEYYGRFVDMGVGRGVKFSARDYMISNGMTKRRPKPWFMDTFYKRLAVLRHIIRERLNNELPLIIARNTKDNVDYKHKSLSL